MNENTTVNAPIVLQPPGAKPEAAPLRDLVKTSAERLAAIDEIVANGYVDATGQRRQARSRQHVNFLAQAGDIELPA